MSIGAFEGTFVCESICCFMAYYTHVSSYFLNDDFLREPYGVVYHVSYGELIGMVVLGWWVMDVLVYEAYTIQVVSIYVDIVWGILGVDKGLPYGT